jgi:GPH family glycoside/pentoside/hexuronide:cation symporter
MGLGRKLAYCLGGPGWQMTGVIVVSIGIYFYLPPEGSGLTPLLSETIFLGFLTAYGLARLIGGLVDSLADPVVGHLSDRSHSRLGRRRAFLVWGLVPMVGAPALLFFPPGDPGSLATFLWLTGILALYYVAFTVYVAPYLALIPEIAPTEKERIDLSRLRAIVGGPVIALYGPAWLAGVAWLRDAGFSAPDAVRWVVLASCAVSLLLSALPIAAVDEHRFASSIRSTLPMRTALVTTLRDRPFLIYLAAQILLILGATMVGPTLPYFARVLLGRDEAFAASLGLAMIPGAVVSFACINWAASRFGSKRTMVASVALLGLILLPLGLLRPDVPGGPNDSWNLAIVLSAISASGLCLAGMLVIPVVILGQLIDRDTVRTGANRSAMYFGVQGLLTKWVFAASGALLSYLFSAYGRSADEPLGVLLVGPIGGSLCLLSAVLYSLYPEQQVITDEVIDEAA